MPMTVKGLPKVRRGFRQVKSVLPEETHRALGREAFRLLAWSAPEVPVAEKHGGTLLGSGQVIERAAQRTWFVVYGVWYAIFVHERTELRHRVGKAKFLEDPFNRLLPGLSRRVRSFIRRGRAARLMK